MGLDPQELHISGLFDKDEKLKFVVPSYQREYVWDKKNWANLFDTIAENESEDFIGSIILVKTAESNKIGNPIKPHEVIDGQQRLTTLSVFFCSLYTVYSKYNIKVHSSTDDNYSQLKTFIALEKGGVVYPRIELQQQGNNNDIYLMLLREVGFKLPEKNVAYGTLRLLFRAYRFFLDKIDEYIIQNRKSEESSEDYNAEDLETLDTLFEKVKQLSTIVLTVPDRNEAINIFSALNSTGTPLSAVDLIKTDVLKASDSSEYYVLGWSTLIDNIKEPNEKVNDRFFRQFLNAFKKHYESKHGFRFEPVITSTNVYANYQRVLRKDNTWIIDEMYESGKDYSHFITLTKYEATGETDLSDLNEALFDLYKAEGTPSYILLLYLFKMRLDYNLEYSHLTDIVQFLIRYFVRRNYTDTPPTRELIRQFITIVENIGTLYCNIDTTTPEKICEYIKTELINSTASLKRLVDVLTGPIYEDNKNATRFILSYLIRKNGDNESKDPWSRDDRGKLQWTIEHVLPQTEKLSNEWIKMVSKGKAADDVRTDKQYAADIQAKYVHTIGNLTLTGYNSTLSARPFLEKRDHRDKNGNPIGYNNGFWLNKDLKDATEWNEVEIKKRAVSLINSIIELVQFDSESPVVIEDDIFNREE